MKLITRVQELENLKAEAIARIRAVLHKRGSDYELIPLDWDEEPSDEELADIQSCPLFILPRGAITVGSPTQARYVISLGIDRIGKTDVLFDTCNVMGEDEQTFRMNKADLPCILAIADRIDYLEETGIHAPDQGQPEEEPLTTANLNKYGKQIYKALKLLTGNDIPEHTLVAITLVRPKGITEFSSISGFTIEMGRQYGESILNTIKQF